MKMKNKINQRRPNMATVQTKSEITKVFEEAIKKSGDLLEGLKVAYAKEKDALEYELSIYKRDETDKIDELVKETKESTEAFVKTKEEYIQTAYNALHEKEKAVEEDLARLESIPELEEDIQKYKGILAAKEREISDLKKDYAHDAVISRMEYEKDLIEKDTQVISLNEKVVDLEIVNKNLTKQLEEAYVRITEMANNTATSAANATTIAALKEVAATKNSTGK
jgi:uncharacterized protein (UPF0147 family)